ncbi:beta-lactamase family protein [Sphingomonas piscis]|uniref:Beta-lactamase n=1 Tax=Sphingomonas piscis TaxID=2714943 RepID=A0A6G7YNN0_9SPHN|nr:serine hydrolase domain-containing protein [Sphingomonas piscis]QIK78337.1 beta-lactamase family protein [Sphingomonas piscis]
MADSRIALSIVLAGLGASAIHSGAATQTPRNMKFNADSILAAAYAQTGPGAAAVVTRDGRLIYVGGRGLADVRRQQPITPETVFELGSIAKQFTAAVVLQLVAEGKIGLDDPLSSVFPGWPQPGARASIRQLLNHTSGLPDYSKVPGFIGKNSGGGGPPTNCWRLAKACRPRPHPVKLGSITTAATPSLVPSSKS